MSDTVQVVFVGPGETEVPDVGTWKSGEVKDVDPSVAEWLTQGSDYFRYWTPVPDDAKPAPTKAKSAKDESTE